MKKEYFLSGEEVLDALRDYLISTRHEEFLTKKGHMDVKFNTAGKYVKVTFELEQK